MGLDVTASRTALLLGCRYAFRGDIPVPTQAVTEPMARGTRIHEAIEKGETLSDPGEQACVDAARVWLIENGLAEHEHAYAWDGVVGTHVGFGRAAYAFAPIDTIMAGTADAILRGADSVRVIDWKTSERSARHALPQLMTLAVIVEADAIAAVELREDGTYVEHHAVDVMPWELDAHAARLRVAIQSIAGADPTPGDHCAESFCPLRGTCPAYTDAVVHVAELVPANALVRRKLTDPLVTTDDVAQMIPLLDLIDDWSEAARKQAKAIVLANGGEVRLDASSVWRKVESSRNGVRAEQALELARKLGASQEELAACTYTTKFDVFKRLKSKEQ